MLNLDQARKPTWALKEPTRTRLTLAPSIDAVNNGRRCHYHIRDGRVLWAKDSDR